jgi:ribose transport system permease protein
LNSLLRRLLSRPWIWSYLGALLVWLAAIVFTHGYGAGGMISAGLALAVFSVITGVAQMFVITLGPGNVDLSLPANIGLASAVAMKVMGGSDSLIALGLGAALVSGIGIGVGNYLLIWLLRIPPIIATLSASFIIQSIGISYGRGLQIKPPPGFAEFTTVQVAGVPLLAIGTVVLTLGFAVLLHRTIYGRSVLAIGQNPRAAWLAGIAVERTRCFTYLLSGALGGVCGALLAGYFRGSSLDIGDEYLLASIALVVIGGTSVSGGKAIHHLNVGTRSEERCSHPVPVPFVLKQYPFAHTAFAVIMAGAEPGVVAGFLEGVVEVSVDEELDSFFNRYLVTADGPVGLGFLTGVEPVDVDECPVTAAKSFPQHVFVGE